VKGKRRLSNGFQSVAHVILSAAKDLTARARQAGSFAALRITNAKWATYANRRRAAISLVLLLFAGCQQKMADQPSYKTLAPNAFFADGRSARPLVAGTVARGHLRTDIEFFTGRKDDHGRPAGTESPAKVQPADATGQVDEKLLYAPFVDEFPFPITKEVLRHGQARYTIYCVVCHDPLGTGQGKIVERGYTAPPSYHIPRLRRAPVGHLFAVITEGYGSMPSYATQIPPCDRWAIVAYLRALQASQHFPEKDVTPAMRAVGQVFNLPSRVALAKPTPRLSPAEARHE
jgi:mono/diheme cytochrome c family protein